MNHELEVPTRQGSILDVVSRQSENARFVVADPDKHPHTGHSADWGSVGRCDTDPISPQVQLVPIERDRWSPASKSGYRHELELGIL